MQELCVNSFVPNDAIFENKDKFIKILTGNRTFANFGKTTLHKCLEENEKVKIISGPNASGKSVYLKQVALICYLAHIGSFVPAQSAQICILDHIFSRIQTVESIATRMSAFLLDLKQVKFVKCFKYFFLLALYLNLRIIQKQLLDVLLPLQLNTPVVNCY